jgi:protein O-GlcNAc transferase
LKDKLINELIRAEKITEAEAVFRNSLPEKTTDEEFFCRFAMLLQNRLQGAAAKEYFLKALAINADNVPALANLALLLKSLGLLGQAKEYYEKALQIDPNYSVLLSNYANALLSLNEYPKAYEAYQKALEQSPDNFRAFSDLLVSLNYTEQNQQAFFEKHKSYAKAYGEKLKSKPLYGHKKIRLAYISGDFKRHSVAYFIEGILHYHNRDEFEIYCYSDVENEDLITTRFKSLADYWRPISQKKNDAVAQIIEQDEIDILIDLASHTGHRNGLFALRPAPLQVTYCGYPNTTGLENMDYRIVDKISDPDGDEYYTEELLKLPRCFLAFSPPDDAPDIQPSPCLQNGYITFGSFNNFTKVNDRVLKCWRQILKQIPHSRLLIKSKQFNDKNFAEQTKKFFTQRGVQPERILIHGYELKLKNHLEWYNKVDIALDPFPYNGTTTTCEALNMGVPVITMKGDRHAARVGATLLSALGMESFITESTEHYRKLAQHLSQDFLQLDSLRQQLREVFQSSPLCDSRELTKEIENHLKTVLSKKGSDAISC